MVNVHTHKAILQVNFKHLHADIAYDKLSGHHKLPSELPVE